MKLDKPLSEIKDKLLVLISEGFGILGYGLTHRHDQNISKTQKEWSDKVLDYLKNTFPTNKESGQFQYVLREAVEYIDMDRAVVNTVSLLEARLKVLEIVLDKLTDYYEFQPLPTRLYIQSIDSFDKVRNVNVKQIQGYLKNGFLNLPEQQIKNAFMEIIGQSYIPNDWGGETEDIYSSFILLNGERVQSSIILKGSGTISRRETHLGDLGTNGDQLERMMRTESSKLYIIQSVKPINQDIINSAEAFIEQKRSRGNHCYYCIIDGQDTAMIMFAYSFLK